MQKVTINTLKRYKQQNNKIVCLTAYDASFAKILSETGVEVILIGDSLGNVIQGQETIIPVLLDDVIYHTRCVSKTNSNALLIADMPFMTYATVDKALENASKLMQAGAHMIKIEGGGHFSTTIKQLNQCGIPVCAHLGLLPQSIHKFGGYHVQSTEDKDAEKLLEEAITLEKAGASLMVLECIPKTLAEEISKNLSIPTIGIGAGPDCDGQILVIYDMLGISPGKMPRFVRDFFATTEARSIQEAIQEYVKAVKNNEFPAEEHCYIFHR